MELSRLCKVVICNLKSLTRTDKDTSTSISGSNWVLGLTDLDSVLIIHTHEDCIRSESNSKLSLIPEHSGSIMGIFMGLAELSGLDHILHVEASSVVDSRLGMSTFGPKLMTHP